MYNNKKYEIKWNILKYYNEIKKFVNFCVVIYLTNIRI